MLFARVVRLAAALAGLWLPGFALAQTPVQITQFPVGGNPIGITSGPDGNLWMWFSGTTSVGRMTPTGALTVFTTGLPFPGSTPAHCVDGRDGGIWFSTGGPIGRVSADTGSAIVFPLPPGSGAADLTFGPDGALWFPDFSTNQIGRMTLAGVVTEYPVPAAFEAPRSITVGPDGALWFTSDLGQVGRMDVTGGGFLFYNLPEYPTPVAQMSAITTGSDGNLWLGVQTLTGGNVVRVTPLGQITEFPLPDVAGNVLDITAGPDGALWFTEESANQIGRITTSGVLTEYALAPGSGPVGITVGRDRAIWFTELSGFVGRISGGPLAASSIPMLGSTMLFCLGAALAASAMLLIRRF